MTLAWLFGARKDDGDCATKAAIMLDDELVRMDNGRNAPELPPESVKGPATLVQELVDKILNLPVFFSAY